MPRPPAVPLSYPTDHLVGQAPALQTLRAQIRHLASFDTVGNPHVPTVLVQGETGTGKGLVARIIHDSGPRSRGPFLEVNCAAIPDNLLEAELFGFEAGAYTDAKRAKPGLFEVAAGGSFFLDEIDALPLLLQSKLLKAIEEKRVRRIGAVAERPVDVKIIVASQADLPTRVAQGRFRLDLYHRLAVVLLELPPLRTRGDDILGLARQFLQQYATGHQLTPKRLSLGAEAWLMRYPWPGNVRELSHLMERATLLPSEAVLEAAALERLCVPGPQTPTPHGLEPRTEEGQTVDERVRIQEGLLQAGGNVVRAARILGLSRDTLRYRMRQYGIARPTPAELAARPRPSTSGHALVAPGSVRAGGLTSALSEASEGREPLADASDLVPSWERKPVAVLAVEVTWPDAAAGVPPYEPWTLAAQWMQAIVAKMEGFGGVLLQRTPSMLLIAFGVPQTLEQQPQRAVQAAMALQHLVGAADPLEWSGPRPDVRVALHWGPLVVDAEARTPQVLAVGETLALPVRLLGQVSPREIGVSAPMAQLVEAWCALQPREGLVGSGPGERRTAYTLLGLQQPSMVPPRQRLLSRFVGREPELALLDVRWAQVAAGRGQVVGIMGEPGVGKSRVVDEFTHSHPSSNGLLLEGRAAAYSQATPYRPVIDVLRAYFRLEDRDAAPVIREKVFRTLATLGATLEPALPALLTLLDVPSDDPGWQVLEPAQRRQRTLEAVRSLLLRESQQHPLVLVFENLHWIDTETQAILDRLAESVSSARLLLLVTYRPEYEHQWGHRTWYTQLRLDPLPTASLRALLQELLGDDASLEPLKPALIHRTEGNPFFLEESVRTLVETHVLVGEHGQYQLTREVTASLVAALVPASVQAVLAARIDRLPPNAKQLLQRAAVIGHEIPFALLRAITETPEAELQIRLAHLQRAEFLYEHPVFPEPRYTFQHALTREVAYQSLLTSTRQQSHRRIAEVLEAEFPEIIDTQPELLAQHYTAAACPAQAIPYWQRAGQRATERSASVEAIAHFNQGLALLEELPDTPERIQQELLLHTSLGPALMATKGFAAPEVERAYARARELCQQVGDTPQLFAVLRGLWRYYGVRADFQTAHALGEQLLGVAQLAEDTALLLEAHLALGSTLFWGGDFGLAHAHLERVTALYDPQRHHAHALRYGLDPGVVSLSYTAQILWYLGYPDQALKRTSESLMLAHAFPHPHSQAHARGFAALLQQCRREVPAVSEHVEAVMALSREQEFPQWLAWGAMLRGWVLVEQGQHAEGMTHLRQGLAAFDHLGAALGRPYWLALLAEACGKVGHVEEGLRTAAAALDAIHQSGERRWEAELYRVQGALWLARAPVHAAEAEACFQQALTVARRQQSKLLELRAAMGLSRLWQHQGQRQAARELLAPIYGWFTEGFDTADLQESHALLES